MGGDDRAGAATILTAALEILERGLPHPPLTFCWFIQEEIGLQGLVTCSSRCSASRRWLQLGRRLAGKMTIGATGGYRMNVEVRRRRQPRRRCSGAGRQRHRHRLHRHRRAAPRRLAWAGAKGQEQRHQQRRLHPCRRSDQRRDRPGHAQSRSPQPRPEIPPEARRRNREGASRTPPRK